MRTRLTRKHLITIGIVILIVIVAGIVVATRQAAVPKDEIDTKPPATTQPRESDTESRVEVKDEPVSTIDPATLSSVDIQPFGITVSYETGIPGFEYTIHRSANQTEYVDFSSAELIGTKCTNDTGIFASITKNPSSDEDKTLLISMTKVGNDSYGLSLPESTCTSNVQLFEQFQASFKDAFGALKAISTTDVTE